MKKYQFTVVITKEEDGTLVGSVPSLPGCHTQAKDLPALYNRMQEAVELYLEVQKGKKKKISGDNLVGLHQLDVSV